jgi:hypothetical protein
MNVWISNGFGDVYDEPEHMTVELDLEDLRKHSRPKFLTVKKLNKTLLKIAKENFGHVSYVTPYLTVDNGKVYMCSDNYCVNDDTGEEDFTVDEFEKTYLN